MANEALQPSSVLPDFTADQRKDAEDEATRVSGLLEAIGSAETRLSNDIASLGVALRKIQVNTYWMLWGFRSWGSYLADLATKFGRGRTQLYHVIGVVQDLEESLGPERLNRIGISKLVKLRVVQKAKGFLSEELIQIADNPKNTIEDVERAVLNELGAAAPERGTYRNLNAFPATDGEWEEITRAIETAKRVGEVGHDQPAAVQTKLALLYMAREFYGTYGGQG